MSKVPIHQDWCPYDKKMCVHREKFTGGQKEDRVREEKPFFYPLWLGDQGLQIKRAKDRLTGKKLHNFY